MDDRLWIDAACPASELGFGTIQIDDSIPPTSETAHGGFKPSGFGDDLPSEAVCEDRATRPVMVSPS